MKYDIVVAGLGGQGVVTAAAIIAAAARRAGLQAMQSEQEGVSERGGTVVSYLRLSDAPIAEKTIGRGTADLLLALEPLESRRYLGYLSLSGALVASSDPVLNVPNYPNLDEILLSILQLPRGFIVDATKMAKECGGAQVANIVLAGAATDFLPLTIDDLRGAIVEKFQPKGERVVNVNLEAFEKGRSALRHREMVDEFETLGHAVH